MLSVARLAEVVEQRTLLSASNSLWQPIEQVPVLDTNESFLRTEVFEAYSLNTADIRAVLALVPMEFTGTQAGLEFAVPNPMGDLERFRVFESPIMAPGLAAQFPEIKTFAGQGIDDPAATIRFDVTPAGFHAQVLSPDGAWYVDPYYHLNDLYYATYLGSSAVATDVDYHEGEVEKHDDDDDHGDQSRSANGGAGRSGGEGRSGDGNQPRTGTQLRTYKTAVAATGEYSQFHGGTVASSQAAIVTAINRVTGIYENELSIRLELVANNTAIVYTNAATDPYTNNNAGALLTENQANLDALIGDNNYDIGHVFSTGAGGLARLRSVGVTGIKAQGATGLSSPVADPFYVDYVAHEVGHQFGGNHTFNGDSGACAGNGNNATGYEPGSGSTIQAYAGICGNDNLQPNSDPYFHSLSFDEMIRHVDVGIPNEGTRTNTGNTVPDVDAGLDYVIPARTPFILTASGSDANADDVLTYNWEQRDIGPRQDVNAGDNGASPLFRSFIATTDPTRTFPRLDTLLDNTTIVGETLPTTTRELNFRAIVRDNRTGGGGVNTDDMLINVVDTGAGFAVTSPNTAVTYTGVSSQTVTWNVAGTTGNGINTANVNILMSTDGGLTFPITLATAVTNDGSHDVIIPGIDTDTARIKVEAAGNIFFDVSNTNFSIVSPDVAIVGLDATKFEGDSGLVDFTFEVNRSGALNLVTTADYVVSGTGVYPADAADFGGTFPSGSVSFANGETVKTITVQVAGDRFVESVEEFEVSLINLVGGTDAGRGLGTILNEDVDSIAISFADAEIGEGDGPSATSATIVRTGDMTNELVVALNNSDRSELDVPAQVTIPAGLGSVTFDVAAVDDFELDGTQTVEVTISAVGMVNATASIDVRDNEVGSFGRLLPLGSLVSESKSLATLGGESDQHEFEIFLDAGETLAAVLSPTGGAILNLELVSVSGIHSSPQPGQPAVMEPQSIATAGPYKVRVTGDAATDFELRLLRNSAIEQVVGDSANGSELSLDNTVLGLDFDRYAVTGTAVPVPTNRAPVFTKYNNASAFIDISASGSGLSLDDDGVVAIRTSVGNSIFPAGNVDISNNGGIIADAGASLDFLNTQLPSGNFSNALLPFWDDLTDTAGNVYWEERQVGGIDTLIVQWNRPHADSPDTVAFQLQLFATGPLLLRYAYADVSFGDSRFDNGNSATIGVQASAVTADQYSFNQSVLTAGDVIDFMIPTEDVDEYEIDLAGKAGQTIDVALAGNYGAEFRSQVLEILDTDGTTVLAMATVDPVQPGTTVTNFDLGILGFAVPTDGVYTLRLTSDVAGSYTLVTTNSANFNAEPNEATSLTSLSTSRNALGWVDAVTDQTDSYLIDLVAGTTITLGTATPFDGALGEPLNSLDPEIRIIHPDGVTVVASDVDSATDGKNAGVWFNVPDTGTYRIEISATSGGGEYIVEVAEGIDVSATLASTVAGDEAGTDIVYSLSLSHANGTSTPVTFDISDLGTGTATPGLDYTAIAAGASLTVSPGTNSATFVVTVLNDASLEATENIVAEISNPSLAGIRLEGPTATSIIADDESAVVDFLSTLAATEGGQFDAVFTVTLSLPNETGVPIFFDVADRANGTAIAGLDYNNIDPGSRISIADGSSIGTFFVSAIDDTLLEDDETLSLEISNSSNSAVMISTASATSSIREDDTAFVDLTATTNGSETGPTAVVLTATLDKVNNTGSPIVLYVNDAFSGSATPDSDYTAIPGDAEIVIAVGASSGTYTVPVLDDSILESTETLDVALFGADSSRVLPGSIFATASIADDESANANVSVTANGREAGPVDIVFTVTLSQVNNTGSPIAFDFVDLLTGSATSGVDYTAIAPDARLLVPAGAVAGSFTVTVHDDLRVELDEALDIRVSNPSSAAVSLGVVDATATIFSNDVASASLSKDSDGSESGPSDIVFRVTLDNVNETGLPIVFDLADLGLGTATAGDDYSPIPTNATISVANGELVGTFVVTVVDDGRLESAESVTAEISNPSSSLVTVSSASATANILDNETATATFSMTTQGSEEGLAAIQYTLTLDKPNETSSPITFSLADLGTGSATADVDYVALPGSSSIVVPVGATSATVSISVLDDLLVESTETVELEISNPSSVAVLAVSPVATGQIVNNDTAAFTLTESGAGTVISEAGSSDTFALVLSAMPQTDVVLRITVLDSTEVAANPGTITFTPNNWNVPQTVTVTGIDDFVPDGNQVTGVVVSVDTAASNSLFASLGSVAVAVETTDDEVGRLDVDANGRPDATTDGILIVRYLFSFTGNALIADAIGTAAANSTEGQIIAALDDAPEMLDVDGNGKADATTDGILIVRYLFGFRGDALIADAIGSGATRTTPRAVVDHLNGFMPANGGGSGARSGDGSSDGDAGFDVDVVETSDGNILISWPPVDKADAFRILIQSTNDSSDSRTFETSDNQLGNIQLPSGGYRVWVDAINLSTSAVVATGTADFEVASLNDGRVDSLTNLQFAIIGRLSSQDDVQTDRFRLRNELPTAGFKFSDDVHDASQPDVAEPDVVVESDDQHSNTAVDVVMEEWLANGAWVE